MHPCYDRTDHTCTTPSPIPSSPIAVAHRLDVYRGVNKSSASTSGTGCDGSGMAEAQMSAMVATAMGHGEPR